MRSYLIFSKKWEALSTDFGMQLTFVWYHNYRTIRQWKWKDESCLKSNMISSFVRKRDAANHLHVVVVIISISLIESYYRVLFFQNGHISTNFWSYTNLKIISISHYSSSCAWNIKTLDNYKNWWSYGSGCILQC